MAKEVIIMNKKIINKTLTDIDVNNLGCER